MYLRLAFAVAAHLEPEILLVDEVLAVGDAAFQKKCLGKMGDLAKDGRTILFVSHQLNQIRRLCNRCLWLDEGCLRAYGPTVEVVSAYEAGMSGVSRQENGGTGQASTGQPARFLHSACAKYSDPLAPFRPGPTASVAAKLGYSPPRPSRSHRAEISPAT